MVYGYLQSEYDEIGTLDTYLEGSDQWMKTATSTGRASYDNAPNYFISFPIAFSSNVYCVNVGMNQYYDNYIYDVFAYYDLIKFKFYKYDYSGDSSPYYYPISTQYIAIGN